MQLEVSNPVSDVALAAAVVAGDKNRELIEALRVDDINFIKDALSSLTGVSKDIIGVRKTARINFYYVEGVEYTVVRFNRHLYFGQPMTPDEEDNVDRGLYIALRCPVCQGVYKNINVAFSSGIQSAKLDIANLGNAIAEYRHKYGQACYNCVRHNYSGG